jgi:hypothetical protein
MLDNFERARKSISAEDEEGATTNNRYLEMRDKLMATLGQMGVEQIPTVGTEFDYNLHMAIQQARAPWRRAAVVVATGCQWHVGMAALSRARLPSCGDICSGAESNSLAVRLTIASVCAETVGPI